MKNVDDLWTLKAEIKVIQLKSKNIKTLWKNDLNELLKLNEEYNNNLEKENFSEPIGNVSKIKKKKK